MGALASVVAAAAMAAPSTSLAAGIPGPPGDPLPDGALPVNAGPGSVHHAPPSSGSPAAHTGGSHLKVPGIGPGSGRAGGITGGKVGMPTDDGTGPNSPVADDDGDGAPPSGGDGNGGDGDGNGNGNGSGSGGTGGNTGGSDPDPSAPAFTGALQADTRSAAQQVSDSLATLVDYAFAARTGDVTAQDQRDALDAVLTLSANNIDMDQVQGVVDDVYNGNYDGAANTPTTPTTPSAQELSKDFPELFPPAGQGRESATDGELQKLMDDATPGGSSQPTDDLGDLDPRTPGEQVTESLKTLIDLTAKPGPLDRQDRIDGLNAVLTLDQHGIDLDEVADILHDVATGNYDGAPAHTGGHRSTGKKKGSSGNTTSSSSGNRKPKP